MTATLEQTQADLLKLVRRVQQWAEIVITNEGRPVAKLTGMAQISQSPDRQAWLSKLAQLRQRLTTGKSGLSVEQILEEDRSD